ncbi:Gfo/Idh/MocA family oxidoreductase [Salinibacterium sp.]|uniref:Gfo/Idh/MocA family protein n=1 Tax=Salinibacterium sp. TaxID=1915057 RepID=UPI00286A5622|nr:Gfo/Idh/MocA family oxidoreductase [Salinibacterium sp.]
MSSPSARRKALRLAVVGTGERSSLALAANDKTTGDEIVAAVDTSEAGRLRAVARFGSGITVHSNLRDLVRAGGIDAAFVTTPDVTHAPIAIELLRAGIAVYLEKPMATTLEDADAILTAAHETQTPLYVGHNYRHAAVVKLMRSIILRGEIGQVKAVWCRHFVGNGGDYYFKDWHADRRNTNTLLLQKASHDLDVMHWLAGGYTKRVVAMGDLAVYGQITDRADRSGQMMQEWLSYDNWPPLSQTGLNPVVDVEDVSMMLMELDNGVLASYEQCHFTPDYWRNYTVIGTEGRLENFGDVEGGVVRVWNSRGGYRAFGDVDYPIVEDLEGHQAADGLAVAEFIAHITDRSPTQTSLIAARNAVAAGALAARSMRNGSVPLDVPPLDPAIVDYIERISGTSTPQ